MKEELESLHKNQTWELVEKPVDQKIVGCKWIFKKKDGIRFKARLVAKTFTQIQGIDFNEVFSPVVEHSSIRVLFALVSLHDLELEQLDVKTTFLLIWRKDLYATSRGVCCNRKRRPCVSIKKVFVWLEAVTKAVV